MNINLKFSKMEGLGNDYVVIDESKAEIIPENKKPSISAELCKRRFSVGADGVIFVSPPTDENADIRFRIFNADGSEAEMCGNGIRCFGKFIYENNILNKEKIPVETLGGLKELVLNVDEGIVKSTKVDMGLSTFLTQNIPMKSDKQEFLDEELLVEGIPLKMTVLSVGNPHAVVFTDDLNSVPLENLGQRIEYHSAFPKRINVHFVHVIKDDEIEMVTWERGTGVTLACGTGATSSVLAGYRLGLLNENVLVHLPGGELRIAIYQQEGQLGAHMKGGAEMVFEGEIEVKI